MKIDKIIPLAALGKMKKVFSRNIFTPLEIYNKMLLDLSRCHVPLKTF
jgi:hypothetical protein